MADPIIIHVEEEEIILKETGQGMPGKDGVTPNITVGTVRTVDPDQPADVRKSGTSEDVILDFDIPKGESGGTWGEITGDLADQSDLQVALDGKEAVLTFDTTPTSSSTNPVTSGGVKTYIDGRIIYFYQMAVSAATSATIMTISDSRITADTVVLECTFANPEYITSDVTWTSAAGSITFSGTCTAATTANVTLGQKGN